MPLVRVLSGWEQLSNADFRLYLLTFTKAATVCDSTVIPMAIPSKEYLVHFFANLPLSNGDFSFSF